jgi:hypothetical protein
MTDSDLIEAFLNTNYVITSDVFQGGRLILNIGNHHPELNDYWPDLESWAFITAWNPLPSVLSVKENADRNLQLEQDLNAHNYKYISGYGADKEEQWKEDS